MIDVTINRQNSNAVKIESAMSKFGTTHLLPLWVADMDIASAPCVQEAIRKRALHPIYGYTIYSKEYYQSIEDWMLKRFGLVVDKKFIIPAYGVVPSLNFSIEAFTQMGDGVIVQTPLYPPFVASVQKHRRKLLENRLLYKNDSYSIDFEDFEAKAKEAKLFLFCSPHNPTGRVWDKEELERLIAICEKEEVLIVSDEIHSDIVYQKSHHSMALLAPQRTILLNAPSKSFNIAGLNTSYAIIFNQKIRKAYNNQQRKGGFGDGNIFGIEALIASYTQGESWLEALKLYLKENIDFVNTFLSTHHIPIVSTDTQATYLMWLDCSALGLDDKELEKFFVYKAQLGLNSGVSFGRTGSGFMRLNIATSKEVLKEAMQRLHKAYKKLKNSKGEQNGTT